MGMEAYNGGWEGREDMGEWEGIAKMGNVIGNGMGKGGKNGDGIKTKEQRIRGIKIASVNNFKK